MASRLSVLLEATSGTSQLTMHVNINATELSRINAPISRSMPSMIDQGQAYYWSYAWQLGEQKVDEELAGGLGKTFDDPQDAIRWLLSGDP